MPMSYGDERGLRWPKHCALESWLAPVAEAESTGRCKMGGSRHLAVTDAEPAVRPDEVADTTI